MSYYNSSKLLSRIFFLQNQLKFSYIVHCMSFHLRLLIAPLVSSNFSSRLNNDDYIIICALVLNCLLKLSHFRVFDITDIFLDCYIKRQSINQWSATNKIVLYDVNLESGMLLECTAYVINVSFASDLIKVLIIHFCVLCIIYSTL